MSIYNNDSPNYVCMLGYVGIIGSLENLEEGINSFACFLADVKREKSSLLRGTIVLAYNEELGEVKFFYHLG